MLGCIETGVISIQDESNEVADPAYDLRARFSRSAEGDNFSCSRLPSIPFAFDAEFRPLLLFILEC